MAKLKRSLKTGSQSAQLVNSALLSITTNRQYLQIEAMPPRRTKGQKSKKLVCAQNVLS